MSAVVAFRLHCWQHQTDLMSVSGNPVTILVSGLI